MLDHVSIQCADVAASSAFYDAVLAPLDGHRIADLGGVIGYGGSSGPNFWLGPLADTGHREVHVAFAAPDRATVDAVHRAARDVGAEILHEPRTWPQYHDAYYAVFVRDPDGNNIEAVCHRPPEDS